MPKLHLTAETVNKLPLAGAGKVVLYRDTKLAGFGLRVGETTAAYFVEKRVDGRNVRHTLGRRGQITADQARKSAGVKLGEMTGGTDLNAERKAKNAARAAERAERAALAAYTVKALCDWYIQHQRAAGKQSAVDAAGIFAKHVNGSEFAELPARDLTAKQATTMIRRLVEQDHGPTARKLRSYLRAAYALAQGADTNPQAPAALVLFGVETNPVAATSTIKNANGTRDVKLTEAELGETLRLLREHRAVQHDDALAALELSLLLGGQRPTQVLRLTAADVDLEAGTVTLLDGKGRRETARRHVLPLTDASRELVEAILAVRRADWLFGDKTSQTHKDTLARKGVALLVEAQANVAAKIVKAGGKAPERPKIEARDLRRTAETMLAAMGVSKDVRAQLLSHGLGGVQDRHYDQHSYMNEKRQALQAWADTLDALANGKPAGTNVRTLKHAA